MSYKVTYTADNEEPYCIKCDHVCEWVWTDYKGEKHDNCVEHCGTAHGWYGYKRTEEVSE